MENLSNMPEPVDHLCEMHHCKSAMCVIYSEDLPEFPKWFDAEINKIMERLKEDIRKHREQVSEFNWSNSKYMARKAAREFGEQKDADRA